MRAEIVLAVEVLHAHRGLRGEPMLAAPARSGIARDRAADGAAAPRADRSGSAKIAMSSAPAISRSCSSPRRRVDDLQLDAGMAHAHRRHQVEQIGRRDGAHQAEAQRRLLQADELLRLALGLLGAAEHLLEIGFQRAAQFGQVRVGALAMKQRAAHLLLELLDGARQRRLRHVAALGRAGEIQVLAQREEIADLVHFHRPTPRFAAMTMPSVPAHAGIKSGDVPEARARESVMACAPFFGRALRL